MEQDHQHDAVAFTSDENMMVHDHHQQSADAATGEINVGCLKSSDSRSEPVSVGPVEENSDHHVHAEASSDSDMFMFV
jgi:hypothetical protein